jgi:Spy/CpxP family protein refolding chaperone
MRHTLALIVVTSVVAGSAVAWTAAQQPQAGSAAATSTSIEEVLRAVRTDLQGNRSDILAKNLTLTSAQAAKFWPVYETYQKEQNVIMDDQLKEMQGYIEGYETLDDARALSLLRALFDRDARMNGLRQKWIGEFQKVLGAKTAVRAMQIDRQISLAHQLMFASKLPLAY